MVASRSLRRKPRASSNGTTMAPKPYSGITAEDVATPTRARMMKRQPCLNSARSMAMEFVGCDTLVPLSRLSMAAGSAGLLHVAGHLPGGNSQLLLDSAHVPVLPPGTDLPLRVELEDGVDPHLHPLAALGDIVAALGEHHVLVAGEIDDLEVALPVKLELPLQLGADGIPPHQGLHPRHMGLVAGIGAQKPGDTGKIDILVVKQAEEFPHLGFHRGVHDKPLLG